MRRDTSRVTHTHTHKGGIHRMPMGTVVGAIAPLPSAPTCDCKQARHTTTMFERQALAALGGYMRLTQRRTIATRAMPR